MTPSKICRKCKEEKPLSEFHKNKTCSLGVVGTCRSCTKIKLTPWLERTRQQRTQALTDRCKDRKARAIEHFGGVCGDCGQSFPQCVFEFHHLDPSKKDFNPSAAMRLTEERMWEELSKCIMLCSNCHKIRHWGK